MKLYIINIKRELDLRRLRGNRKGETCKKWGNYIDRARSAYQGSNRIPVDEQYAEEPERLEGNRLEGNKLVVHYWERLLRIFTVENVWFGVACDNSNWEEQCDFNGKKKMRCDLRFTDIIYGRSSVLNTVFGSSLFGSINVAVRLN
jgi:hypothetical protein